MLTGKMVRVRHGRDRLLPIYLDTTDPDWLTVADQLLELFRAHQGLSRGELEDELEEEFGHESNQLVFQGLAKLLEDRCEFETGTTEKTPEEIREVVFRHAAAKRTAAAFDRAAVLTASAEELGLSLDHIEQGLFADLKSAQKLVEFKDTTAERLLQRYNVALVQAILLRATKVTVSVRREPPQRYRQLLRLVKFHRLICDVEKTGPDSYLFQLDGPLSLFSATQKYGLQLAVFLPSILLCKDYEVKADVRWGTQRRPKTLIVMPSMGLVSHAADHGSYVPAELTMFVELFRKKAEGWTITEETEIKPLGDGFWVPDFRLVHQASGRAVLLEVLGFWRKASAEMHLERLRRFAPEPFLLAVSDQLHIEEGELEGLPAEIVCFRQMPLVDEVIRQAEAVLKNQSSP